MQCGESISQPWHRTKPLMRAVIQPRGFRASLEAEKKRSTHTAGRSLILTKTLKAVKSRTPKGTKTQRIQGHLKLTEGFFSELTKCDRSVCLKEFQTDSALCTQTSYPRSNRWLRIIMKERMPTSGNWPFKGFPHNLTFSESMCKIFEYWDVCHSQNHFIKN